MDFNQKIFQAINPKGESKMNTTKWQFFLAVMIFIDGCEAALEYGTDWLFGLGHIIVTVAEWIIAPLFFFFLLWQNVRMTVPRVLSIFSVFLGEEAAGDDFAPLWSLDVAFLWWADSKDKLLDKMGVAGNIARQAIDQGKQEENEADRRSKNFAIREKAENEENTSNEESLSIESETPETAANDNIVDLRAYMPQNEQKQEELQKAA